ncbi:MAG: insulinase family protein [Clostridium butyricum]|nr:insulinase family protein [Clostridium butyricum]
MEEYILENNLKLIYKKCESELSSICISLKAGAGVEKDKLGVAHTTEHMLYKGTLNRNEVQINKELSNIFGFQNAMTNYPYVIYYGTLLNEDLENGIEIFSDIIINPIFPIEGFKEEMDVIRQELNEWDEELDQYCEDKLFFNCFNDRRIKYPIIGTKESLNNIAINDIKSFYVENYFPENTSIVVISSKSFEEVKDMISKYFGEWQKRKLNREEEILIQYDKLLSKRFDDKREGIKTCKVQMIFQIDELDYNEVKLLKIFNEYFAEGVNSVLYDTLRTQNGLVYDVLTSINNENYIKLYKIIFTTSKENVDKCIELINDCINKLDYYKSNINKNDIDRFIKSLKIKRLFKEEKSIMLAKELAIYDIMFGNYNVYINELSNTSAIKKEEVFEVAEKVLKTSSVQVVY